jgi:hypothetical protein
MRATASSQRKSGPARERRAVDVRAVFSAYERSVRIVSSDFCAERVVGRRMRWDVRDRVARNSSMRRWQAPRPTPL